MEFTEHFIDEVLRMWTPVPQHLERIAKVDVQIGPYKIPKGPLICFGKKDMLYDIIFFI